jgi:hypothetical protein
MLASIAAPLIGPGSATGPAIGLGLPQSNHTKQSPRDLCRAGKGKNYSIYSMSNQDKTDGVFLFLRSNNMYTFNINIIHNLNFRILPRSSKMK